jgi:hypothetical protein
MKPKTKKHPEKVEIEITETLVIKGRNFELRWTPGSRLWYKGDIRRVDKALEMYRQLKEEVPAKIYKLGNAMEIESQEQEEVQ